MCKVNVEDYTDDEEVPRDEVAIRTPEPPSETSDSELAMPEESVRDTKCPAQSQLGGAS